VEQQSQVDMVLEELLNEFDQGLIEPGKRIKAAQISSRLGISRGPVREALAILSGRGLIELKKDLGAVLKPMSVESLIKTWEIFEPILSYAIVTGTNNIGNRAEVLESIEQAMERIERNAPVERGFQFYVLLTDYHWIINDLSGNEFVQDTVEKMNIMYWVRFLSNYINVDETWPQYVKNYQRITDGILAGDGPGAAAAWSFHVRWSIGQMRLGVERQSGAC